MGDHIGPLRVVVVVAVIGIWVTTIVDGGKEVVVAVGVMTAVEAPNIG